MTNAKETPSPRIKKRKKREANRLEMLPLPSPTHLQQIAFSLNKKLAAEVAEQKYAPVKRVLTLLSLGAGLAVTLAAPGAARTFLPLLKGEKNAFADFKEFNYCYLERTLKRLEKEKLVRRKETGNRTVFEVTAHGKRRVLKYALEELKIEKPKEWNGRWTLISYDVPESLAYLRDYLRQALHRLGFYPFHKSLFLHAYPCQNELEFIREYFGVAANVRIFTVTRIKNDRVFRDYFGV